MLPFGVNIPAAVPQRSEIPGGLTNYSVFMSAVYVNAPILYKMYQTKSVSLPHCFHPVMGWQWIMHTLSKAFNYIYKSID
jgi:hypothetical protein